MATIALTVYVWRQPHTGGYALLGIASLDPPAVERDLSADSFGQPSVTNSSLTVNQTCPRTGFVTQRAPSATVRSSSQ